MGDVSILLASDLASGGFVDEGADRRRRDHFAILRDVAGDVRSLGDGLLATFEDTADAFATVAGVRAAVRRHNRRHPDRPLDVRMGVHAGPPIRSEEDSYGAAVAVVRRLCAAAEPGHALASADVQALTDADATFSDPSTIQIAAGETVRAYRVDVPLGVQLELPPALAAAPGGLVERSETDELARAWARALDGAPQLVWVRGRTGFGKTTIAALLARRAQRDDGLVLYARCSAAADPVTAAVRPYVEACPERVIREHERETPGIGDLARGGTLEPAKLAGFLFDVAIDAPVLLVLDDLHDADERTLSFVERVVRGDVAAPVCVVAAYDPDQVRHDSPLTGLIETLGARVRMSGLTLEAVQELVVSRLGTEDEAVATRVWEATDGCPLLVDDALRRVVAEGDVRLAEGVLEALGARVSSLDDDSRSAVATLASGRDVDEADLAGAIEAGIVAIPDGGGPVLVHPVLEELLRPSGTATRIPAPVVVPDAPELEPAPELFAEPRSLREIDPFVHLRAFPGSVDVETARGDLEVAAPGAAEALLSSGVAALEGRCEDGERSASAAAEQASDDTTRWTAQVLGGWHAWASGRIDEGLEVISQAWQEADAADDAIAAPLSAAAGAWAHLLVLDLPRARGLLLREIAQRRAPESSDERRLLSDALSAVGVLTGRRSEAERLARHADLEGTRSTGQPLVAACVGDWDEAERLWLGSRERFRKGGGVLGWWNDCLLARVLRRRGEVGLATGLLEETLLGVADRIVPAELWVRAELAILAATSGDAGRASGHVDACEQLASSGAWRGLAGRVVLGRALADVAAGDLGAAGERFEHALACFGRYTLPWEEAETLELWGRAMLDAGQGDGHAKLDAAERIYDDCGAAPQWREPLTG